MECLFDPKDSVLQKKLAQKKSLRGGKSRPGGAAAPPLPALMQVPFKRALRKALQGTAAVAKK